MAGQRIHGTTRRQPLTVFRDEERHTLGEWDAEPYEMTDWRTAKVHPDHHIACQYALYSVPSATCPPGQKVEVRLGSKLVRIYHRGRLIKVHPRQDRGGRSTDPDDYPAELSAYTLRAPEQIKRSAASQGPAVAAYAERLFDGPLPWAKLRQGHRRLKNALNQALILRGGRDFESEDEYRQFVRGVVDRRNRLVASKLKAERRYLRPLPPAPVPEYANYRCRVRRWSTIRVANRTYSVPSRLIGMVVDVRLYADHIEVYYKDHLVESMERIHGAGEARIDYRHIIGSLVRKPGAFARYRFREQMFPTHTFRLAYDALCGWRGERADVEYVRILHLAATTMESKVDGGTQEAA